jgi:Ser/Thr protein kinase RdoA (MazF antagonist)
MPGLAYLEAMTGHFNTPLRAGYSTATAESVGSFLATRYELPTPVECTLLHRGFNDSFEVRSADGQRYVLRLSCRRIRGEADVASETEFLTYLDKVGVPVVVPVPARDGALFACGLLPEGPRPVVLFRHVDGRNPLAGVSTDARAQGVTLARIHAAAENYPGAKAGRYRLDLDHLLHRQVTAVLNVRTLATETRERLVGLASRLSASVIAGRDLTWTFCHGDCHGNNARIPTNGPRAGQAVFFDFDDGGYGYLTYDLAVYLWASVFFQRNRFAMWHAFIEGYRSIRPITPADFDAVHLFVPIRHIWLMGEYAGRIAEWGSRAVPAEWLTEQVEILQDWEDEKLSPGLL